MSSVVRSFLVPTFFIACVGVIGACNDAAGPQPAPATVVINDFKGPIYVAVGDHFVIPVRVLDQAGLSISPRPDVVWSSSDTSVATVTQQAEFLAKSSGLTVIRAQVSAGTKTLSDSVIMGVR